MCPRRLNVSASTAIKPLSDRKARKQFAIKFYGKSNRLHESGHEWLACVLTADWAMYKIPDR